MQVIQESLLKFLTSMRLIYIMHYDGNDFKIINKNHSFKAMSDLK
ncbi:hypothetical protein AO372_0895 [Moraxella catarrhalis]|nr:hypothetical protein AO379_0023 [Moraxella catarrhalis]OAV18605.1 hypothetical protein AO373_1189 [Moraxella catarrhalis]OAV21577.1 hypothetical protein AO372_0895 [Moraxella catarrhalis]OAV36511.1 hypothetical protein AO365_0906 [Moraxella catarrhalis]OAV38024.1 hypothetical protein AO364_0169 [Moraxella catarrhalis]